MSTHRVSTRPLAPEVRPGAEASVLVEAGQILIQQGDMEEARRLLRAAAQADPECPEAWLGLASLAKGRQEREILLRRVLALDPANRQARIELAHLEDSLDRSEPAVSGSRRRLPRVLWAVPVLVVALAVAAMLVWGPIHSSLAWLLPPATPTPTPTPTSTPSEIAGRFVPQLDAALSSSDWQRALDIVGIMNGLDPVAEVVQDWSLRTYMQYGKSLAQGGYAAKAQEQFEQAVTLAPDNAEAQLWQESTQEYVHGLEALESSDWETAIHSFGTVFGSLPDYADAFDRLVQSYRSLAQEAAESGDWAAIIDALTGAHERVLAEPVITDLLADAYRTRGILLQEEGKLKKARLDLEAALAIHPDDAEAQAHLDEVMYRLFPPKRIEIDISKQRLYAWEGDTQVHRFVVSTGLPGQDTAAGHFKVLDKIPMAYSSVWRLKMPHWLGIYYVGGIENGIHALPIRPDGSVMWGGLLGQRASYGCIILSTKDAKTLYNWAEVGTKVDIHY